MCLCGQSKVSGTHIVGQGEMYNGERDGVDEEMRQIGERDTKKICISDDI